VICDRYPIGELKLMDGPQCAGILPTARPSRLIGFLAGKEEEYYRRIMPPDLLVVLKVDPEIAVRRRPDEVPAWVRARNTEVWEFDWGATRARVIDASQSRSEVVSRLKSLIWASL
jgi:thymidylate kinase